MTMQFLIQLQTCALDSVIPLTGTRMCDHVESLCTKSCPTAGLVHRVEMWMFPGCRSVDRIRSWIVGRHPHVSINGGAEGCEASTAYRCGLRSSLVGQSTSGDTTSSDAIA